MGWHCRVRVPAQPDWSHRPTVRSILQGECQISSLKAKWSMYNLLFCFKVEIWLLVPVLICSDYSICTARAILFRYAYILFHSQLVISRVLLIRQDWAASTTAPNWPLWSGGLRSSPASLPGWQRGRRTRTRNSELFRQMSKQGFFCEPDRISSLLFFE